MKFLFLFLVVIFHAFGSTHPFEFEFKDIIYGIDDEMEVCGIYQEPEIASVLSQSELRLAIKTTRLKMRKTKMYVTNQHGDQVVARNNLQKGMIEFTEFGWRRMITDQAQKRSIVLHEYLGILEVEIENYLTSNLILAKIEDCQSRKDSPLDRSYIERGLNSEIAMITNRKTKDYLKLVRENHQIHILLYTADKVTKINTLYYKHRPADINLLKIRGHSQYHDLLTGSKHWASQCFSRNGNSDYPIVVIPVVGQLLCAIMVPLPGVFGVLFGAPLEAGRALSGYGSKDIAETKFSKALIGKGVKLSNANFMKLIELIEWYM